MKDFKPTQIFYEEEIKEYKSGIKLMEKYKDIQIPKTVIDSHNNIEELRKRENKDFTKMKKYLIIGKRKTHKYVENKKVSDYLVPYTSSGCTASCLYCYLVCNYNKCSYLRIFVNREEMLEKLIKHSNKSEKENTYEIGSNSDLILENTITKNLEWTIEEFAKNNRGYITFPTKFDMVDSLLDLKHNNRVIIRVSMNPTEVITATEFGTSNLENRIIAINKLRKAGYKVGILIAPIILIDNWKKYYKKLFITLKEKLSDEVKKDVFFEVILMTYSYIHTKINEEAFPNAINLYDKEKMTGRGIGKYAYKQEYRFEAEEFLKILFHKYFKNNEILYFS